MNNLLIIPVIGAIALLYTFWFSKWVANRDAGTDRMKRIAGYITEGAMAFLKAEYTRLAWFVVIVAVLLGVTSNADNTSPLIALSFAVGAFCSGLAGYIGMRVATNANVRTANAARGGLNQALNVAFRGGSVMGMGVVGLGVVGLSLLYLFYKGQEGWDITGDRGISDDEGFTTITGRMSRFSKIGGEMVPHIKIEQELERITGKTEREREEVFRSMAVEWIRSNPFAYFKLCMIL